VFLGLTGGETLSVGTDYLFTLHFESKDVGLHSIFVTNTLCNTVKAKNYTFAQGISLSLNTGLMYRITPAVPTITLLDKAVVYNGLAAAIGPAVLQGISDTDTPTGNVTYAYYSDAACLHAISDGPINVGAYYVKAYLDENGNYCAAQSNGAKLTITPALPMVTLSDKTVVYSGSAASAGPVAVHGISDLDVPTGVVSYTYYSDATCLTALPGAPKEAGTYYVKAFLAATGDYAAVTSNKATLTITPAKPGLTLANKSAVYTGFPVSFSQHI
jgi:hypothetical protein